MTEKVMSSKRVVHITSVHSCYDVRIFHKECRSLERAGYEVTLIVPCDKDEVVEGVNVVAVKKQSNRFLRMTKTVWDVYQKAKRIQTALYHFHDPELFWVGVLLKMRGAKIIYDSHENVSLQILNKEWLPKYLRKFVSSVFGFFEIWFTRYFDYTIAATLSIRDYFIGIRLTNCIDINNYPILSEVDRNVIKSESKKDQICYIGGISENRGIKEMILAVDMLKGVQLVLAGSFDTHDLQQKCSRLAGWNKILDKGFVSRSMTSIIMRQSKVGVVLFHPAFNHIEAQPNKLFEYMASGIPVLASNFPSWKKIIVDNNCGICVDPFNLDEIADAIRYIIDHPKEAEIMGQNGRRLVLEKYNWENEAKKLIKIYEEILI